MKEDGCTYEHSEVKKARHAFARVRVSRSVVSDSSAAPWTIACQAPLSRGILQARILEWVAMPSSRGSSRPGDQTHISYVYCLGQAGFLFFVFCFLITGTTWEALAYRQLSGKRKCALCHGRGHLVVLGMNVRTATCGFVSVGIQL